MINTHFISWRNSPYFQSLVLFGIFTTLAFGQGERRAERMEGSVHVAQRQNEPSRASVEAIRGMRRPARKFSMGRLSAAESAPVTRKPGLTPVGVNRSVPADVLTQGEWSNSPDGHRVWRLSLQSTGAEALRIHFDDFHVGNGKVWLLGTAPDGSAETTGPYTNDGLFSDGQFWSDLVAGDSLIVAYEPADGDTSEAVPFRVVEVSHRFQNATLKSAVTASTATADRVPLAAAASCNLDVSCYSDYRDAASAVALMVFESGGSTYECTGSLISSAAQPAVPFFLTANHCISTADEARSLITYFNYQTSACNGSVPSLSSSPHINGATYITSQPMALGDFSLLQLSGFPNVDVKVLGWYSNEIDANQDVTGISHPRGDYKRIAFGQRTGDVTIRFSGNETMPANKGYQVDWLQGTTQSGSSGSPLVATIGGKQYVVGTLSGGPDVNDNNSAQVCATRNLNASYGRFSAAFAYLGPILSSTTGTGAGGGTTGSPQATITANPNPITLSSGQTYGKTTLSWQASGVSSVQVRVGSPNGTPLTGLSGPTGSADTGDWVLDGMTFYLQDASDGNSLGAGKTLASVRVQVNAPGNSGNTGAKSGAITANPNPIPVGAAQSTGVTTLRWQATGVTQVQVRVGSPTGTPLTGFDGPSGTATTGNWVTDGMTFYLQDATDGNSSGAAKTLATVRVQLTSGGGGNSGNAQGTITANPNPIVVSAGRTTGRTTIQWQASGVTAVQIRINSPNGSSLTGIVGPSGSVRTTSFVTDGMVFYLQDASSGNSAGSSKTLATVRVRVAN